MRRYETRSTMMTFLDDYDLIPVRILTHLSRQLDLPPVLSIAAPDRDATVSEHEQRIRQYLGYQQFDQSLQQRLTRWLEARAAEGPLPKDLLRDAMDQLRVWRVVPPVQSTIERLVASVATGAQQNIFERLSSELSLELKQALDELLQPHDGDSRSRLFRLKEYPPHASAPARSSSTSSGITTVSRSVQSMALELPLLQTGSGLESRQ